MGRRLSRSDVWALMVDGVGMVIWLLVMVHLLVGLASGGGGNVSYGVILFGVGWAVVSFARELGSRWGRRGLMGEMAEAPGFSVKRVLSVGCTFLVALTYGAVLVIESERELELSAPPLWVVGLVIGFYGGALLLGWETARQLGLAWRERPPVRGSGRRLMGQLAGAGVFALIFIGTLRFAVLTISLFSVSGFYNSIKWWSTEGACLVAGEFLLVAGMAYFLRGVYWQVRLLFKARSE